MSFPESCKDSKEYFYFKCIKIVLFIYLIGFYLWCSFKFRENYQQIELGFGIIWDVLLIRDVSSIS